MENRIKLKVLGITYSQIQTGAYALVLSEIEGKKRIPVIIGTSEAQSIAVQLERIVPPRPLTHDLFIKSLNEFSISLQEVFIYKFEDGVFCAELKFQQAGGEFRKIDSRTSDAVALSLRCGAPIYTTPEILERAGIEFDEEKAAQMASERSASPVSLKHKIEELYGRLDEAVKKEDYEEASRLRDMIRTLKNDPEAMFPSENTDTE